MSAKNELNELIEDIDSAIGDVIEEVKMRRWVKRLRVIGDCVDTGLAEAIAEMRCHSDKADAAAASEAKPLIDRLYELRTYLAGQALYDHACTCRDAMAAITSERAASAKAWEKVIERLPKTADGVPITFGMEVWSPDPAGGTFSPPVSGLVNGIYAKNFDDYKGECTIGYGDWEAGNQELFSTHEAAIAAHSAEDKNR